MTVFYKVLGQTNPAINTSIDLYTAQPNVSTLVSTIVICNQSTAASTFTIAIRPAGITANVKHYLNSNTAISANDTISLTIGITLATTDVITVSAGSNSVSFTAFGAEIGTLTGTVLPTINTVQVTDNSYTATGSETVSTGGGYIKLTGSNFASNAVAYVDGATATATTYVNTSEVRAQVPAKSAGSYPLMLFNGTSPGIIYPAGIKYAVTPTATIAWRYQPGSIGNLAPNTNYSIGPIASVNYGTVSFAVTAGSLPVGMTLNASTGVISGSSSALTTSSFTITVTCQDYSDSRAYSILVQVITIVGVELLVVAGGGSGGVGGGGGAGGLLYYGAESVTNRLTPNGSAVTMTGSYTITVGPGGTSPGVSNDVATQGINSSVIGTGVSVTALGGGSGGTSITTYGGGAFGTGFKGAIGGSGGGAGGNAAGDSTLIAGGVGTGSGVTLQGFGGGSCPSLGNSPAGGGGGAGTAGGNGSSGVSGAGGAGLQYSISGTATFYAGGGGGGGYNVTVGTGGSGIGGTGGLDFNSTNSTPGAVNTGSGGGGTRINGTGGSGVVILRYPSTYALATSTTGVAAGFPIISGSYRVYKWNSSGSITF